MLGWTSCELICASATNICANAGLSESPGSTRLIATLREKPSAPTLEPANTSAIPPPPSRRSRRYFPETPEVIDGAIIARRACTWRLVLVQFGSIAARDQRVVAALAHARAPRLDQPDERLGELGIELRAGAALDLADRDLVGQGAAIGAVGRHRVVGVGDRDDAADERDVVAGRARAGSRRRRTTRGGTSSRRSGRAGTAPARGCACPSRGAGGTPRPPRASACRAC